MLEVGQITGCFFFSGQVGFIHEKSYPDVTRITNIIASSWATGLYKWMVLPNLTYTCMSCHLYVQCIHSFWTLWCHIRVVGHQWITLMTAQLTSWPSCTKNWYTLIEQSQYFQGSIRVDPSNLGAVSLVSDLWSNIKVFICLPFLDRGIQLKNKLMLCYL